MKMCEILTKSTIELLCAIVTVISIISAYKDRQTRKRYASGYMQFVEKALSSERLSRISEIINKASKCSDSPKAWLLAAYNTDEHMELFGGLYGLESVSAIIHDAVLSPKVKETISKQISSFLATQKIRSFVEANKQRFPELWSFVKQSCQPIESAL